MCVCVVRDLLVCNSIKEMKERAEGERDTHTPPKNVKRNERECAYPDEERERRRRERREREDRARKKE